METHENTTTVMEIAYHILVSDESLRNIFTPALFLLSLSFIFFLAILFLRRKNKIQDEKIIRDAGRPITIQTPSWSARLSSGLSKTRAHFRENLFRTFSKKKWDKDTLEKLHETLYRSDFGVSATDKIVAQLSKNSEEMSGQKESSLYETLKAFIIKELGSNKKLIDSEATPLVVLVVGVNGVGKTTTIGKLASYYSGQGKKVLLGAADTFRAAAADQLELWAERSSSLCVRGKEGTDPASVAFDAVKKAKAEKADLCFIDTAGRLQNKKELMDELAKIKRVIQKEIPEAPHQTLLILDGTTGQNAFSQARAFNEVVEVSGYAVTKLDGTAKGGVLVGIVNESQKPIYFIGVGEKAEDLRPFDAAEYVEALFN